MTLRSAPPQFHARIAGAAYLLVIVIGLLNGLLIDSQIVVPSNDAITFQNVMAHLSLFRVGVAATLLLYVLVVVLAWSFYEVLKSVTPHLARLGLLFRVAEAVVGMSTILTSLLVAEFLGSATRASAFDPPQLHSLVGGVLEARTTGMDLVLVLIGVGGTIFCRLLLISRFVPRWLSAWGVLTYLSMLVLGIISLLWRDHPDVLEVVFYGPGALFELTIGSWLLVKGVDEEQWRAVAEPRLGASR